MNWEEIRKSQYKAYLKWVNWVMRDKYADNVVVSSETDETGREGYLVEWDTLGSNTFRGQDIRALYSFFDEQGISIGVCVTMHPSKDATQYYADFCIDNVLAFEMPEYDARTKAEEEAFIKAFEILELRLNE